MSSHDLQALADRDGIRVYGAQRVSSAPPVWEVQLTYPYAKFKELGADPDDPLCTPGWPCMTPHRPGVGDVLEQWFATIAGRGPERPPSHVVAALQRDLRHLLGNRYEEYRRASGRVSGGSPSAAASGGCLAVMLGVLSAACAAIWLLV
ncbi:hypothetical protein [Streptomyces sp. NPDC053542]|uniref:hypothetical protein n=1 Tax=Streptomyces sp. NPDC053542 TaxID=3365710 RepID=UPI0037D51A86